MPELTRYRCNARPARALCALAAASALGVASLAQAAEGVLPELDCLVEPFQVVDVGSARGIVKSIEVERSDTVVANDVLVRLDDAEQQATVRQARARAQFTGDLKAREAALAFAQRKLARISELYASDAISSYQRDEVETELEVARQELRQAQEARDLARLDLERANVELAKRTIRSPVDGIVVERYVGPGEFVNDTPLVRVAQMDPLRVEAIAPAALFGQVRAGMRARVKAEAQTDAPLLARVTIVDRLIDPASGTFGIRLEMPNPDYSVPSGLNCKLQLEPLAADMDNEFEPERAAPLPGSSGTSQPVLSAGRAPQGAATSAGPSRTAAAGAAKVTRSAGDATTDRSPTATSPGKRDTDSAPAASNRAAANLAAPAPRPLVAPGDGGIGLAAQPDAGAAACVTLGPIDDERLWRKLQVRLAGEPVAVTARSDSADEQVIGYFVVTAAAPTMDQTRALGKRLRREGVSDLAVLTRPPYAQRVSLGLYTKIDGARARKAQIDALDLGVVTEILPRMAGVETHWLDLAASAEVLDARPWRGVAPDVDAAPCADARFVADAKTGVR